MNVWRIAGEQQRAAEQLATRTASAAVEGDPEPPATKMRRLKANAQKALSFNYDVFCARKFDDPS